MRIAKKRGNRVLQYLNRQSATHRRKVVQEHIQGITGFQMFEQDPHRNPGADEDRSTPMDLWIRDNTW